MNYRIVEVLTVILLLSCFSAAYSQDENDPFKEGSSGKSEWSTEPKTDEAGWSDLSAGIGKNDRITGKPGCPIVVVGKSIFKTESLERIGTIDFDYRNYHLTDISDDGKYFAVAVSSHNTPSAVQVFDTSTGKLVSEIEKREKEILDVLIFTRDKYLITGGRSSPKLYVWNVEDGKKVKEFAFSDRRTRLKTGSVAASPNGHYLAAVEEDDLQVWQVAKSKVVAKMQPPKLELPENAKTTGKQRRPSSNDHVFYLRVDAGHQVFSGWKRIGMHFQSSRQSFVELEQTLSARS